MFCVVWREGTCEPLLDILVLCIVDAHMRCVPSRLQQGSYRERGVYKVDSNGHHLRVRPLEKRSDRPSTRCEVSQL